MLLVETCTGFDGVNASRARWISWASSSVVTGVSRMIGVGVGINPAIFLKARFAE